MSIIIFLKYRLLRKRKQKHDLTEHVLHDAVVKQSLSFAFNTHILIRIINKNVKKLRSLQPINVFLRLYNKGEA